MTIIGAYQAKIHREREPWYLEGEISEKLYQTLWNDSRGYYTHGRKYVPVSEEDLPGDDIDDESYVYYKCVETGEFFQVEIYVTATRFTPPPPEEERPVEVTGQMTLSDHP